KLALPPLAPACAVKLIGQLVSMGPPKPPRPPLIGRNDVPPHTVLLTPAVPGAPPVVSSHALKPWLPLPPLPPTIDADASTAAASSPPAPEPPGETPPPTIWTRT